MTLLSIENSKLWKRLSTKIMYLILILLVVAASGLFRYYQYYKHVDVHANQLFPQAGKLTSRRMHRAGKHRFRRLKTEKTTKVTVPFWAT